MSQFFTYVNNKLHAEHLPLADIAAAVDTPFYCYSLAALQLNYQTLHTALAEFNPLLCYAVKANPNLAVLEALAACGAGADIVSVGELERALQAGIAPEKIVYSGVGKAYHELKAALIAGIHQINVESLVELGDISAVALELGRTAQVALRVNPDVDPLTHDKISTGEEDTKFGLPRSQIPAALKLCRTLPGIELKGLSIHIGSQLTDFEPFRQAFRFLAQLVRECRAEGHNIERLDLGGGIGIPYQDQAIPALTNYAAIVRETVGDLGCALAFEPGRYLVANAGILVSKVILVKRGGDKNFVIIDAGMNDLIRPAMYEARHKIIPVRPAPKHMENFTLVGPICETSDLFGDAYELPEPAGGDLMAVLDTGAYGTAMASCYNAKPLVPEVMVNGRDFAIVRRRIAVAEQIGWESLPHWAKQRQAA